MIGRLMPPIFRYQRMQRTLIVGGGTLLLYGCYCEKGVLRNDSGSETQWPQTRETAVGKRKVGESSHLGSNTGPPLISALDDDHKTPRAVHDDLHAWASVSSKVRVAASSIEWSSIGDFITNYFIPEWAQAIPSYAHKLQREIDMAPGSLADEIWQESEDVYINPEVAFRASVRLGEELCAEEKTFQTNRKQHTVKALAKYLDIPEHDINADDVPTIAICGSGGGLRALVAGAGSYLSAQEAGLFDCITYTAGVSGSCWLQTLYNSSLGGQRYDKIIEHLKKRIGVHIAFPPAALGLLTSAPTNKFLLSSFVEKLKGDPTADFGLVDVYGLLLAARLLVPRFDLGVFDRDLKLSNQRSYIDNGAQPLPIYTAVRHEIPLDEQTSKQEKIEGVASEESKEKANREAWFQWFEFTPYEFWCEELEAGIPTWSIGRQFQNGHDLCRDNGLGVLELKIPILLGIWGSAFCATLSHYYKEIRPLVKGLSGFSDIDELIEEKNEDLVRVHPIGAASLPNYALGLENQLPATCPKSIFKASHLSLMDSGMSNNLPIYPLLRPGRDVDILIAFDASADIKTENWLSVADGYAKQRGIKGWPMGAGWPNEDVTQDQARQELEAAQATTAQEAAGKMAAARERQREQKNTTKTMVQEGKHIDKAQADLGYCTIWMGKTQERTSSDEPPQSKRVDPDTDWKLLEPDDGIAVIYFPFLPNPKVAGVDPNTSEFMSTWNFVYTPEEIDKVVALARANFEEGNEQTKKCIRAVFERKKKARLLREERASISKWRRRVTDHGDHFL